MLPHLDPARYFLLANTAGCYSAADAMRYARLARAAGFNEWVKLEVIGDQETLLPDTAALLEATRTLAAEGFKVIAYTNDDLITALRLEDAGAVAVMPLASPIGSGLGMLNPYAIRTIKHRLSVPVIVDAGVGTASDACITMEQGVDGILMNTGSPPPRIRCAWRTRCGSPSRRDAWRYLAGRMPRREVAVPSSPIDGDARMTDRRADDCVRRGRRSHRRRGASRPNLRRSARRRAARRGVRARASRRSTRATAAGRASSCTACCAGALARRVSRRARARRARAPRSRSLDLLRLGAYQLLSHGQRARRTPRSRRRWSSRSGATASARASWRTRCCAASDRERDDRSRCPRPTDPVGRARARALASALARRALGRALGRRGDASGCSTRTTPRRRSCARPYRHRARAARGDARERGRARRRRAARARQHRSSPSGVVAHGARRVPQGAVLRAGSGVDARHAVRGRSDRTRASPICARRRAARRSSCRARRGIVVAGDASFARLARVRREPAPPRGAQHLSRSWPTRAIRRVREMDAVLDRRAVHRHRHVPPSSRRALAAQGLRPRGDGGAAARDPARRGGRRAAGRAAHLQHLLARARGERRADRELPRRASATGSSSRRRRARCPRACSTPAGCACSRSGTAPTARSRRGSGRVGG